MRMLCFFLMLAPFSAMAALNIFACTPEWGSLAKELGGDKASVYVATTALQDPHKIEARPSLIARARNADLIVCTGAELEIGWLPLVQSQSGNAKIQAGRPGYFEASSVATMIEKPERFDRSMGDVHPLGNPHFWLDPENGRRIARAFKDKLSEMQPADAAFFDHNLKDFEQRLTDAEKRWDAQMAPYKGHKVVTYHRSLPNFAKRFGLDVVDYVEPKPGIPPTPSHTLEVINKMKQENIKLILVEPYFDMRTPNSVAQAVGGMALVLLPSVGGEKQVQTYFQLFDYDVNLLTSAFGKYK